MLVVEAHAVLSDPRQRERVHSRRGSRRHNRFYARCCGIPRIDRSSLALLVNFRSVEGFSTASTVLATIHGAPDAGKRIIFGGRNQGYCRDPRGAISKLPSSVGGGGGKSIDGNEL
jgi:hypothetical protein